MYKQDIDRSEPRRSTSLYPGKQVSVADKEHSGWRKMLTWLELLSSCSLVIIVDIPEE